MDLGRLATLADATITDNANIALAVTFTMCSLHWWVVLDDWKGIWVFSTGKCSCIHMEFSCPLSGIFQPNFEDQLPVYGVSETLRMTCNRPCVRFLIKNIIVVQSTLRNPSMTTTNAIQIVIHSSEEIPNNDKSASKVVDNIESDEIPTCRICLEPELEDLDPIMPLGCGCHYGLGQAHRNCLIKWFCQRRFVSILNFDGIPGSKNCEICKKKLSPSIQGLLNVHWRPFLIQGLAKMNSTLRRREIRAPRQVEPEDGLTYIKMGCIGFMVLFVGFFITYLLLLVFDYFGML